MDNVNKKHWASFIGKNVTTYMPKFLKFKTFGTFGETKFKGTWHWPAFFVPEFWLFYRKMYMLAAVYVAVAMWAGAVFNLIGMIISGMAANYWYYRHARSEIRSLVSDHNSKPDLAEVPLETYLAERGGTNSFWVTFAFIVFVMLLTGLFNPEIITDSYQITTYHV